MNKKTQKEHANTSNDVGIKGSGMSQKRLLRLSASKETKQEKT